MPGERSGPSDQIEPGTAGQAVEVREGRGDVGDVVDAHFAVTDLAGNGERHGKVARVDLTTFSQVQVLDLTTTDADLKGFVGGFASGDYGYFVPNANFAYFGKVARVDLNDFTTVQVLDLTTTDPDLKGFRGGFASGDYGYFVPFDNGARFGKVARIALA